GGTARRRACRGGEAGTRVREIDAPGISVRAVEETRPASLKAEVMEGIRQILPVEGAETVHAVAKREDVNAAIGGHELSELEFLRDGSAYRCVGSDRIHARKFYPVAIHLCEEFPTGGRATDATRSGTVDIGRAARATEPATHHVGALSSHHRGL